MANYDKGMVELLITSHIFPNEFPTIKCTVQACACDCIYVVMCVWTAYVDTRAISTHLFLCCTASIIYFAWALSPLQRLYHLNLEVKIRGIDCWRRLDKHSSTRQNPKHQRILRRHRMPIILWLEEILQFPAPPRMVETC